MEKNKNLIESLIEEAYIRTFKNHENRVALSNEYQKLNLNRFWHHQKFMDFWDLSKMPYSEHYHEEKHGDVKFLLADNLEFVPDSKNGKSNKVRDLGNDIVTDFFMAKPSHTLDLTWMKPKDFFRFQDSIQYNGLQNILVNVDNLLHSSLRAYSTQYESNENLDLNLIVNANKTKLSPKEQITAFRDFFEYQEKNQGSYHVNHVTLDGFNRTVYNAIFYYLRDEKGITVGKRQQLTIEPNSKILKADHTLPDDLTK